MRQQVSTREDKIRMIERLYKRKEDMMYHIALGVVKRREDAEDAVHEAFTSLMRSIEKIPCEEKELDAYLTTAVKNEAFRVLNRREKRERFEIRDYEAVTQENTLNRLLLEEIQQYILQLDERSKEIIYRKYVYGRSYEEIAREMNLTQDNARKILSRAVKKLNKLYNRK